jgi:poly-gamma-glutamate synthesis protein (capsule biosynthesis protein)
MHWGQEYNLDVTAEQRELAEFLTQEGADLIIGSHPHVIEPAEWITSKNGNRAFCVYSLGNFLSSQDKRVSMLGGMLKVAIKKDGNTTIQSAEILPIVTHYEKGWKNYRVYPLYAYTDELAKKHYVNGYDKPISTDYLWDTAKKVYGSYMADEKK